MGRGGPAGGRRCWGAALTGLCRGAAALLGCPGFPRAHALLLGGMVAAGPLLRGRGDPHSLLASPHNRLEARLTGSALSWTWLLIGSLLVASQPWLRPPWGRALRALLRLAVAVGVSRAGHALGHALEAATGQCRAATPLGTLLLPLGDPAQCRGAGHSWEGFGPAPQAFALVHCGLGLAEEAAALGRSLYGRGKMAAGRGWGEESKMAARSKMAAGYGLEEESKMAPRSKMAAGYGLEEESKMASRSKMAAGYGLEEESKMASRSKMAAWWGWGEESKMAPRSKMAAGYGLEEESKMAPRSKMAAWWGWGKESKMAAGYAGSEESKMAARSKMAPGYGLEEESKMAAGSGWAWPHSIWRPMWAGGGHLGRPYMGSGGGHLDGRRSPYGGGHFERHGGHFEPRTGGHLDGRRSPYDGGHFDGGHFESHPVLSPYAGGHFEQHGRHLEPPGRHFEHPGRHLEHPGRHFEHPGRHFEPHGRHLEHPSGYFNRPGGHFEAHGGHFDRSSGHFEPHGGHFEPHGGHFEAHSGHFEPHRGHFEPHGSHFEPPGGHFEPRHGDFSASPRPAGGGHLGEAPPLALSALYLLALALLVTWHLLLAVTLTYRHTWARNAAGAALGWAGWAVTYRGWYRWAWSPGPPGWG